MKFSSIAIACLTLAGAAVSTSAWADKASLLRATGNVPERAECPANTEVNRSGGVLKCSVTLVFERGSICPPANKPNYVTIQMAGADKCLPAVTGDVASVPSAMNPVAGPPKLKGQSGLPGDIMGYLTAVGPAALLGPDEGRYQRVVNAGGADKFVAEKIVHLWPASYPVHYTLGKNPANGVSCPNGYNDVTGRSQDSLGCEKIEKKRPMCQNVNGIGWRLEVKRGEDRCQGPTEGPTKPDGEHAGPGNDWDLDTDAVGNEDRWVRVSYTRPVGR
jgi:hypothetical protein